MSGLALQQRTDRAVGAPAKPATLVQRRSNFGGPGAVTAAPIRDAGVPLEPATRAVMEPSFGTSFEHIRVHDGAHAHDQARDLGARAYAAGSDIVFGEGQYQPHTDSGLALIGHELAHSVQQGGVQMKSVGALPAAADRELEAQADRAAEAATAGRPVQTLSTIGAPAVLRAPLDEPAPAPSTKPDNPGPSDLPEDITIVEESPAGPGANFVTVRIAALKVPPKGAGSWVTKAFKEVVQNQGMVINPVFNGKSASIIKEKAGEDYRQIWLEKYGFPSLSAMADGFVKAAAGDTEVKDKIEQADVKKIVKAFKSNKQIDSGCDIDHIVEKQMGGASIRSNMQLLVASKNRSAGSVTKDRLLGDVQRVRALRPNVTKLQISYKDVQFDTETADASFEIETLLQSGKIVGDKQIVDKGDGEPVELRAGGRKEVTRVRDKGPTPVAEHVRRIIPGLKLTNYIRATGKGKQKGQDRVEAEIASKPLLPVPGATITLIAEPAAGSAASEKGQDDAAVQPEAETLKATEFRDLKIEDKGNKDIGFYYPYLSKGKFTHLEIVDKVGIKGTGEIYPSVKFLNKIEVEFAPDLLKAKASLDPDKLKSPSGFFRFTSGSISLQLAPELRPEGELGFEVGPKGRPLIDGSIRATVAGGAFVAMGTLKAARKIPAIDAASGDVTYHSQKGWSGELRVTSSKLGNAQVTGSLGFKSEGENLKAQGLVKLTMAMPNKKTLTLGAHWYGGPLKYIGEFDWEKPFPIIERAHVKAEYSDDELSIDAQNVAFKFRNLWSGSASIHYRRREGGRAKMWGDGHVDVETANKKGKGGLALAIDEEGELTGTGYVTYQITPKIKPRLAVTLAKGNKLNVKGEVDLDPVTLFDAWPAPPNDRRTLMDFKPRPIPIPTPIPSVSGRIVLRASVGYSFYFGPGMLLDTKIGGEFDPLEEDPNVKAWFRSTLSIPAGFSLFGDFGGGLGAEAGWGAVALDGTLNVTPEIGINLTPTFPVKADYAQGAFSISAEPKIEAGLFAKLGVDLRATFSAAWGLWDHTWKWPLGEVHKKLGPQLVIKLGTLGYSTKDGPTWPKSISVEPENIDPMEIVKDLLRDAKDEKKPNPNHDPAAQPPAGISRDI